VTAPWVIYQVTLIDGTLIIGGQSATLPDPQKRETIEERP